MYQHFWLSLVLWSKHNKQLARSELEIEILIEVFVLKNELSA